MLDQKSRRLLILTVAVSLSLVSACSKSENKIASSRGPITISATNYFKEKDLKPSIDLWNKSHPNEQVTGIFSKDDNQTALQSKWRKDFVSGRQTADVYAADDVFTAEAVSRGMVDDLTNKVDTRELFSSLALSGKYNKKQYGIPRGGNGGILFYRKDLVKAPETQSQLRSSCSVVKEHKGMSCYAGQFGEYEGRTNNFEEAVYSAGGEIINSDGVLVINSKASRSGLQDMVDLFNSGIAPKDSISWMETEGLKEFNAGRLLFWRSWPYLYDAAVQGSAPGTVGVTALPGIPAVGAIDFYMSSRSKYKDTVVDFIKYSIGEESQKIVYRDSRVPAKASFYTNASLLASNPLLKVIRDSLLVAKPRASFTRYSEASAAIQKEVGLALIGAQSVDATINNLSSKLKEFV